MDGNVSSESPKSFPHHPHAPSKGRTCWLAHSYHIDHFEFTVFKQAGETAVDLSFKSILMRGSSFFSAKAEAQGNITNCEHYFLLPSQQV